MKIVVTDGKTEASVEVTWDKTPMALLSLCIDGLLATMESDWRETISIVHVPIPVQTPNDEPEFKFEVGQRVRVKGVGYKVMTIAERKKSEHNAKSLYRLQYEVGGGVSFEWSDDELEPA